MNKAPQTPAKLPSSRAFSLVQRLMQSAAIAEDYGVWGAKEFLLEGAWPQSKELQQSHWNCLHALWDEISEVEYGAEFDNEPREVEREIIALLFAYDALRIELAVLSCRLESIAQRNPDLAADLGTMLFPESLFGKQNEA